MLLIAVVKIWLLLIAVLAVTIVSRITLVSADLLVLAITWKATFKASRDDIRAFGQRTSLSAILFRDGALILMLPPICSSSSVFPVTCGWPTGVTYFVCAER